MHPLRSPLLVGSLLLAGALAAGCNDDDNGTAPPDGGSPPVVAEFTLEDVNPTSATVGRGVSPRDYLTQVSAWYFGHST